MSEAKSVLVRVTIGDNLTCSFPDGNVVSSSKGRVRFENFTNLEAEVRFDTADAFRVTHDEAIVFEVSKLGNAGEHPFTVHEVVDGQADDTISGEGVIKIDGRF
ncbi:MAG: hypothetical protein JJU03_09995 [Idiomarina sp.]|nr:hypothetical protein [Idiomarina sp.]